MSRISKSKKLPELKPESPANDSPEGEAWEVETILDRKYHRSSRDFRYLVKWKGWPIEESTWEPIENLLGAFDMLQAFEMNYQQVVLPLETSYEASGLPSKPIDFYFITSADEPKRRKRANKGKKNNESKEDNKTTSKVELKSGNKNVKDSKSGKKVDTKEQDIDTKMIEVKPNKSEKLEKPKKNSAKSKKGVVKKAESRMDFKVDGIPEIVIKPYDSKGALDEEKTHSRDLMEQIESPQIFIQDFLLEDDGFGWNDVPDQRHLESSNTKEQINKNDKSLKEKGKALGVGVENVSVAKTTPPKQTSILNLEGVRQAKIELNRQSFQFNFDNKSQNSQWRQSASSKDDHFVTTSKDHLILPSQPVLQKSQSYNLSSGFSVKNSNQLSSTLEPLKPTVKTEFKTPVVLVNSFNKAENNNKPSEPEVNLEDVRWRETIDLALRFRQEMKTSTPNHLGWSDVLRWARNNQMVLDVVTEVNKLKEAFESQIKNTSTGNDANQSKESKEVKKAKRNADKAKSKERKDEIDGKSEKKKRRNSKKKMSKEAIRDMEKNPEDKPRSRKKVVAYVVKNSVKKEEIEPVAQTSNQEAVGKDNAVANVEKMVEENPEAEKKVLLIARQGSLKTKEVKKEKIEETNQTNRIIKKRYLDPTYGYQEQNSKALLLENVTHSQNYAEILSDLQRFNDEYFKDKVAKYTKGNRKGFLEDICPEGNFKEDQIETIKKISWGGPATMVKQDYLFKVIWKPRADGMQKEPSIMSWEDLKSGAPQEAMQFVFSNLLNIVSKYGTFNEI